MTVLRVVHAFTRGKTGKKLVIHPPRTCAIIQVPEADEGALSTVFNVATGRRSRLLEG
jgi:hypothetical protein